MTKEELINLTLKQLQESFKHSPECFEIESPDSYRLMGQIIIWRFRVVVDGKTIPDPNNANRTVIVALSDVPNSAYQKTLSCHIFFREVDNLNMAIMCDAKAEINFYVPLLNRSARRFMKLRKAIIKRNAHANSMDYISKLTSIFPTTHDDDLLF